MDIKQSSEKGRPHHLSDSRTVLKFYINTNLYFITKSYQSLLFSAH